MDSADSPEESNNSPQGLPIVRETSNLSPRTPLGVPPCARRFSVSKSGSQGLQSTSEPSNLSPPPAFNVPSQGLPIINETSNLSPTTPLNVPERAWRFYAFNDGYQGLAIMSEPSNQSPTPAFNVPSQGSPITNETGSLSPAPPFNMPPRAQRFSVFTPGSQGLPIISETSNLSSTLPFNVPLHTQRFSMHDSHRHPFMSPGVQLRCPRTPLVRANFTEPWRPTISEQDGGWKNSLPFANGSGNDQTVHPSANPGKSLADPVNMDVIYQNNSPNLARKQCQHIDQPQDNVVWREVPVKLPPNYHATPHPFINQDPGDSTNKSEDAQNISETNLDVGAHLNAEIERLLSLSKPTFSNILQSIQHPRQNLRPILVVSNVEPSTSGLHQLKTNRHSEIHSDGQGARSLSLARKQSPFNAIQTVSYPKRCLVPTPTMGNGESSSSGLQPTNLFNSDGASVKSAHTGSCSVGESQSEDMFNSVAKSSFRESTDGSLPSLLFGHLMESSDKSVSCSETHSCQDRFNKKECDDEVHVARETVVSRNPVAFSPRVVRPRLEPSASGYGKGGTRASPSSSRHIRGCKCKKSTCLKNYCDCYQSKVGCSDGCRCEGCQNVYGQKREEGIRKGPLSGEENNQGAGFSFSDSFYMPAPANDSHNAHLGTVQNSTLLPEVGIRKGPLSGEENNQGAGSSFSDSFYMRANDSHNTHLGTDQNSTLLPPQLPPTQEEDIATLWSSLQNDFELPGSHFYLGDNYSVLETTKEGLDQLSFDQTPDLDNAETKDEFEFLTLNHQPGETGASSEVLDYMYWTEFPFASSHFSGADHQDWVGSRISPLLDFGETQLDQVTANVHESHNILTDNQPQPLEDPPMSFNFVKVSSQNKKRVSSPRDSVQEFGSSAPVGSVKSTPASPAKRMKNPEDQRGNK